MRTDWSKRTDPEAYQNFDETGQHTPGPSAEAVRRRLPGTPDARLAATLPRESYWAQLGAGA